MATWFFDFVSPFCFLQWRRLRALGGRLPIDPTPVLLAAILDHHGQKGPAEIPAKRKFTYQHVVWRARRDGVDLKFPPAHPFNPLPALRLSVALDNKPDAITAIFEHLWLKGHVGDTAESLSDIGRAFGLADVPSAIGAAEVKRLLRHNTETALLNEVFGVPTLAFGSVKFWGDDATEMALDYAERRLDLGDAEYSRIVALPAAAARRGG